MYTHTHIPQNANVSKTCFIHVLTFFCFQSQNSDKSKKQQPAHVANVYNVCRYFFSLSQREKNRNVDISIWKAVKRKNIPRIFTYIITAAIGVPQIVQKIKRNDKNETTAHRLRGLVVCRIVDNIRYSSTIRLGSSMDMICSLGMVLLNPAPNNCPCHWTHAVEWSHSNQSAANKIDKNTLF